MKWKIKTKKAKDAKVLISRKGPNIGDTKQIVKFAILPTRVKDYYVWLEKYITFYRFEKTFKIVAAHDNLYNTRFENYNIIEYYDWVLQ